MDHTVWVFLHLLLFVYWLGGDLGVFLLAKAAKRSSLSFAERAFALQMAVRIDLIPRLCFALMWPVGLQVTASGGFAIVPPAAIIVSWIFAFGWIGLLFAIGRFEAQPLGATLTQINLGLQLLVMLVIGYFGVTALLGMGPLPGGWFGAKVLLFALIFAASIGIDLAFRPIGPAFARLASEGSQPDIETAIAGAIDGAIRWVWMLYGLLVLIAFFGVTKVI